MRADHRPTTGTGSPRWSGRARARQPNDVDVLLRSSFRVRGKRPGASRSSEPSARGRVAKVIGGLSKGVVIHVQAVPTIAYGDCGWCVGGGHRHCTCPVSRVEFRAQRSTSQRRTEIAGAIDVQFRQIRSRNHPGSPAVVAAARARYGNGAPSCVHHIAWAATARCRAIVATASAPRDVRWWFCQATGFARFVSRRQSQRRGTERAGRWRQVPE